MHISLIQTSLYWEDFYKNIQHLEEKINQLDQKFDLVVFPEMFTSGFTMQPEKVAQNMNGEAIKWLKKMAEKHQIAICGSLIIEEKGKYYNRFMFVTPQLEIFYYNKRHLFALANEHLHYTAGEEKVIVTYKDWKICLQVCYDLRFPAFSRNHEDYDLLIYVANWPKPRIKAWDILLKARAIENMCFVVGVNRIGEDTSELIYNGHSQVIDELGDYLVEPYETDETKTVSLSKVKLLETRKKLPFLNDRDDYKIL